MIDHDEYRALVVKLAQKPPRTTNSTIRFPKPSVTTILGTLSVTIGLVVQVVVFLGLSHLTVLQADENPFANPSLHRTATVVWGLIAVFGGWLGIVGVMIARSRGRLLAPLSLVGMVLCLLAAVLGRLPLSESVGTSIVFLCLIIVPPAMLYLGVRKVSQMPSTDSPAENHPSAPVTVARELADF